MKTPAGLKSGLGAHSTYSDGSESGGMNRHLATQSRIQRSDRTATPRARAASIRLVRRSQLSEMTTSGRSSAVTLLWYGTAAAFPFRADAAFLPPASSQCGGWAVSSARMVPP